MQAIHAKILETLKKSGFENRSIKVFGSLQLNIIIECESEKSADKWLNMVHAFAKTLNKNAKITKTKTIFDYKQVKGGFLNRPKIDGFLIVAMA